MKLDKLLLVLMVCMWSGLAFSDSVTYAITVNTSSIAGTNGSLDFQFNPGPLSTQAASIEILGFSGGTLGTSTSAGDVSGTLPGIVTIDNGSIFNDYFTSYTFGNTLGFDVSFLGPALTSPDGTSTSGSSFAFSMFSDAAGTMPVLTNDPNGFAVTASVNLNGSTMLTTPSPEATVPEPDAAFLLSMGIAAFMIGRHKYRTGFPSECSDRRCNWRLTG
jgi:hypothetical protein